MENFEFQPRQLKEMCAEHFLPDGVTEIDVVFNKNGDGIATRTVNMDPKDPHMTIDFTVNDKRYELQHHPSTGAEIFMDGLDKEGNRLLTKVDSSTSEYKTAYDTATKIGFDTLPACTVE